MKEIEIDGQRFELPDGIELQEQEVEMVPPNKYIFGLNVTHTGELDKMGKDIKSFMETIGEGEVEIQVSVNAKLVEFKDKVVGFRTDELEPAIGYAHETEDDYYDEEDYDDDEEAKGTNKKTIRARKGSDLRKKR